MENPFEKYYLDRPARTLVDTLSDRSLDANRHREKVNSLVMSLVIQYLGEYLKVLSRDPREIGRATREKKETMRTRMSGGNFTKKLLTGSLAGDVDAGRTNDDFPGLDCLMDTASTAALFKEIAFNGRFEKRGQFIGADFGSGTGILTLATAIAGRRSGAQAPFTMGLDREAESVRRSTEVLSRLLGPKEVMMSTADICSPNLIRTLFHGLPLSFLVSETVSDETPSMHIVGGNLEHSRQPDNLLTAGMRLLNTALEPYFEVLDATMKERPGFLQDLRKGTTAMFPDFVNGDFVPDGRKGATLKLRTSPSPEVPMRLPNVGAEFYSYEQPVAESARDPRWSRFPSRDGL